MFMKEAIGLTPSSKKSNGFEIWIREWASGADLWEATYGENGHIAKILAARHPIG